MAAGLFVLAPLSLVLSGRVAQAGMLGLSVLGLGASLFGLLTGPVTLALPVGQPGAGLHLALDALSAFLLLPVLVSAAAVAACASDEQAAPLLPAFVGCMVLTLLAGDGFTLTLGFSGTALAAWSLIPGKSPLLGLAAFGTVCLVSALALLAPAGALDLGFAALRTARPEGWAVLALVLLGAGWAAGLAPLHLWLLPAHPTLPAPVAALISGGMTKVALYVLVRVLFDLCGPAVPAWWGVPLLVTGAASAVLGMLWANMESDLVSVLAASTIGHIGLIATGLGVALAARGADLPALAALALGGALLHALAHGLFGTLLLLAAGAVQDRVGVRLLSELGGLIHHMPGTTLAALVGAASLAALPPFAGFAGVWALLQSLLAAPRIGGVALQSLLAVTAALAALAVGLGAMAAVRLVGVAFLGRPRTPGAAEAYDAPRPVRVTLAVLVGLSLLLGLLPGAALHLADPAMRTLAGADLRGAGLLLVAPAVDAPGYSAPGIAVLLGLCLAGAAWITRVRMARGERRAPAWDGGFGPPTDPATQYGAASTAQPLARTLGATLLAAREAVEAPPPGNPRPARYGLALRDPAEPLLLAPVLWVRERLSALADRATHLTARQGLAVTIAVLLILLALRVW